MTTHRRTAAALAVLALAGAGLLGLTACGASGAVSSGAAAAVTEDLAALGVEEQALTALGFAPAETVAAVETAEAAPSESAPAGKRRADRRRPLNRELLRGRVLHAEAVVQTKDGTKTIISQHGAITAINATTVTVKSADGFTMTWTFDKDLRVLERRRTVQPTDLAPGAEIGVAGAKSGDGGVARLIVHRVTK